MAKLIPGKIRTEGLALYEAGQVEILEVKEQLIYSQIEGQELRYSLNDTAVFCPCDLFQKKGYCAHLAALESFLKQDEEGKGLLDALTHEQVDHQILSPKLSFGSQFLEGLLKPCYEESYQLVAVGHEDRLTQQIWWSLRLRRLPDERSYVIRDIPAFLDTVKKGSHYQIGKSYYEPLIYEAFDEASRFLLDFLQGLSGAEFFYPNAGRNLYFPPSLFEQGVHLLMDLEDFSLEYSVFTYDELLFYDLQSDFQIYDFKVEAHASYFELFVKEKKFKWLYGGDFLLLGQEVFEVSQEQKSLLKALKDLPMGKDGEKVIQFSLDEQTRLASALVELGKLGPVSAPESLIIRNFQPHFYFDLAEDGRLEVSLTFDYGTRQVASKKELADLPFASNLDQERAVFDQLLGAGFLDDFRSLGPKLEGKDIYTFFRKTLPAFESLGSVELADRLSQLYQLEKPAIAVDSKGGLLEIGFDFTTIAQGEVDEALSALFQASDFYVSRSGKVLVFDEETKRISQTLQQLRAKIGPDGKVHTKRIAAYHLSELLKDQDRVHFSEDFKNLAHDLIHPEDFELPTLKVAAKLRDYQEIGVKWMAMLHHYGFGGILADDMGLGKTLQSISFLTSQLKPESRVLILAPSSLIYNWADEFKKFAPETDVAVVYGPKPSRDSLIAEDHQVVITSYASFRQDVEEYSRLTFDYLFLDEAQVMKNAQTKIAQHLRSFEVEHTFALSGTPIENHLGELWSIFQIVLPGLLPGKKEFLKLSSEQVSKYIQPFIMRRKKEEVLEELPELTEVIYRNELLDAQKAIYLAQLKQMQERVMLASDEELNRNKMEILSGLMRLRQICDTPALFLEDYEEDSGKLESLRELLLQLQESGHRVLIFSQFRGMLERIEFELGQLGMTSYKITGSTPAKERQDMTTSFNQGEKDAFLISLKAGGVGLNLTGADTVILVDLWWNPAVEAQAISRAHRMGQTRKVEVYRMVTRGTIEEKIQELQESKRHLVSTILDGTESRGSLSLEDIREILGISAS